MTGSTRQRGAEAAYCTDCGSPTSHAPAGLAVCPPCTDRARRRRIAADELRAWKCYGADTTPFR